MPDHLTQETFKAGVVVQGTATVPHPPSNNTDAASKQYVDARTPKITASGTAPPSPAIGDLWLDLS
jgi:hypothetical protein